jgi:hypothetical protein
VVNGGHAERRNGRYIFGPVVDEDRLRR